MKARCAPLDRNPYHGARGIRVCAEWQKFEAFRDWALINGYAADLSIDRIDGDAGYEPGNCRWATPSAQRTNRRKQ
jgi:hypothetical protein